MLPSKTERRKKMQMTQDLQTFLRDGCGASLRHDPTIEPIGAAVSKGRTGIRINGWLAAWPVELKVTAPMMAPGQNATIEMFQIMPRDDFPQQALVMADAASGGRRNCTMLCLNRYELLQLVVAGELFRRLRDFLKDRQQEDEAFLQGVTNPFHEEGEEDDDLPASPDDQSAPGKGSNAPPQDDGDTPPDTPGR